ncbi:MAG TPA: DUF4184 family protein [Acidimicrobiales bacterium]
MPFPLVSHQGLAAPALLVDRRARLDGVALMVGSLAPDLVYAFVDEGDDLLPWSLLWFVLPVAVAGAWVHRRWVAWPLAAHLPDLDGSRRRRFRLRLRLRDAALAAGDRPGLVAGALSGLLGGLTHVLADGFTHPEPWVTDTLPWLYDEVPFPVKGDVFLYNLLRLLGTVGGALLAALALWLTARRRTRDGVPRPDLPVPTPASYRRLLVPTAVGTLVGAAIVLAAWSSPPERPPAIMRATIVVAVALVVGCRRAAGELARSSPARPVSLSAAGR